MSLLNANAVFGHEEYIHLVVMVSLSQEPTLGIYKVRLPHVLCVWDGDSNDCEIVGGRWIFYTF
jgi:hypothetical protein